VKTLAGLAMGMERDSHWTSPSRPVDFFDVKGCLEDLLEVLQIKGMKFVRSEDIPYLHPGKASVIRMGEEVLGALGEVHPEVLGRYEIHGSVFLFEINFERMIEWAEEGRWFRPLPKFPAVYRDLSIVVDETLEVERLAETIWKLNQPFIDEIQLFDIYRGVPVPSGKKGVSYRIRYQAADRTLTDEEVNQYHEEVISRLRNVFSIELRH
jgi:phenylalanyl-tRNA synthetase beta chain